MKRLIIALIFLLVAAPLYAGVEPFFKGEWGIGPQKIQKLHGNEPVDVYAHKEDKTVNHVYHSRVNGHLAQITYTFKEEMIGNNLRGVFFEFLFENNRFNNLTLEELQALAFKLMEDVQNPADPFAGEYLATANSGFADWYLKGVWRNKTTVAEMTAVYFAAKNAGDYGTSSLYAIFYDADTALARQRYAEAMKETARLRQQDAEQP